MEALKEFINNVYPLWRQLIKARSISIFDFMFKLAETVIIFVKHIVLIYLVLSHIYIGYSVKTCILKV